MLLSAELGAVEHAEQPQGDFADDAPCVELELVSLWLQRISSAQEETLASLASVVASGTQAAAVHAP